jgi:6-phosphogluconolactonase
MEVCADAQAVARAVANRLVQQSREAISAVDGFHLALSGGTTPLLLYQLLVSAEFRSQIDWSAVHLFWGDERCVPPEHPESNYGMARRELLARVPIPAANVHRMEAERADVEQAARDYKEVLRRSLPLNAQGLPSFDLILLGLGADGHTASLLPEWKDWRHAANWVSAPEVIHGGVRRMTLTLPVLNAARQVIFMVTGSAKADILRRVMMDGDQSLPAQSVRPVAGELLFIVDAAAAARLNEAAL